jgi:hypothetical protein
MFSDQNFICSYQSRANYMTYPSHTPRFNHDNGVLDEVYKFGTFAAV